MILSILFLIAFIVILLIVLRFNVKIASVLILLIGFCATCGIYFLQPQMHKPFSIDIVEYFIKINKDGSMTTTKQVTTTVIKDKEKEDSAE